MTRIMIRRLGAYPFFTMSRKPPLRGAAKRSSSLFGRDAKMAKPLGSDPRFKSSAQILGSGGARRDRTDDLLLAKQALSQLSYGPVFVPILPGSAHSKRKRATRNWWAWKDLNFRPHAYQARALTN